MSVDVLGVGNAIVDVFAELDPALAASFGLEIGSMTLVDDETSGRLRQWSGWSGGASGGSAANTTVGVVSLGGSAGFVGRVAEDTVGDRFCDDLRAVGVAFERPTSRPESGGEPAAGGPASTGRCLVLVAPDGERTMATYLGAANLLAAGDLRPEHFAGAQVVYLEGYLSDAPDGYELLRLAARLARAAGAAVAVSLSDPFCVERHRQLFLELAGGADLVFANAAEAMLLAGEEHLEGALAALGSLGGTAVVTLGALGAVVQAGGRRLDLAACPVARVVDTTGAGDLYAAGFLYGWTRGADLEACGKLGAIAAAEIVGQLGARPLRRLAELVAAR